MFFFQTCLEHIYIIPQNLKKKVPTHTFIHKLAKAQHQNTTKWSQTSKLIWVWHRNIWDGKWEFPLKKIGIIRVQDWIAQDQSQQFPWLRQNDATEPFCSFFKWWHLRWKITSRFMTGPPAWEGHRGSCWWRARTWACLLRKQGVTNSWNVLRRDWYKVDDFPETNIQTWSSFMWRKTSLIQIESWF